MHSTTSTVSDILRISYTATKQQYQCCPVGVNILQRPLSISSDQSQTASGSHASTPPTPQLVYLSKPLHDTVCVPCTLYCHEAALRLPWIGPGFLSTSPARSSSPRRKTQGLTTASDNHLPMQATRLRHAGQKVKGRDCGGSRGESHYRTWTYRVTLTCVTDSCRVGQSRQSDGAHSLS